MDNFCSSKSIGKWISVIYRKFQVDINKSLKAYNLNSSQYIYLIELYNEDNLNQECLGKKLFIDKSATARALKQLEDNGYITRCINPDDKRSNFVMLTQKAYDIQEDLYALLTAWNEKLTAGLSESQYNTVYTLLEQMARDLVDQE